MPSNSQKGSSMTPAQRRAYTEAYRRARKTREGSPDSLFGGSVAHTAGQKAAQQAGAEEVSRPPRRKKKK